MASSVKMISDRLGVETSQARAIRNLMISAEQGSAKDVDAAMDGIDAILDGHGVEAIRGDYHVNNCYYDIVALYVNMGDVYNTTVIYETDKDKFHVTDLGSFLERYSKKYSIY